MKTPTTQPLKDQRGLALVLAILVMLLISIQGLAGQHRCCGSSGTNYYRAPNRNWGYDTLFDTSLPPGTPVGILVTRHRWSQA